MLAAKKSLWFEKIFAIYNRNLLERRFHILRVLGSNFLQNKDYKIPLIIYANHSSWWDGLIIYDIQTRFGFEHYVMMEEKQLQKMPLFRRIGAFSVVRENPREAIKSINYAAALLQENSNRAVTIFPQGEILPNDIRPLRFFNGLARIVKKVGLCAAVPIALRYEFLGNFKPEIYVKIGEPDFFAFEDNLNVKNLTANLTMRLTDTLNSLKHDLTDRHTSDYHFF